MELKLKEIIEALDNSSGQLFFDRIVTALSSSLNVDYVFIASLDDERHISKTISLAAKGSIVDNFEYDLKDTPCDDVSNNSVCCITENITELYPKDQLLIDMNIEAYIGSPLNDSTGKVIGLVVALSEKPVKNAEAVTTLFKIFSGRIAVEMERATLELTNKKAIESLESLNKTLEQKVKKQVQEKLAQEKYLFEQSRLAQMGEMISMIAHQWRQPLGTIGSIAVDLQLKQQLKQFDLDTKEGQKESSEYYAEKLANIEKLTQSMTKTIDDFRNFYKTNKELVPISLKELIQKSISIIEGSLVGQGIEINYDFNSDEQVNVFDSEMMHVILNIVKNSQDIFNESNMKNLFISITTKEKSIIICDNAGGVPEDIIDKIFDPYFSTKSEMNGTGLGLYMSKKIVEEHHNGKLFVENKDNGACFTIELNNS